MQERWRQVPNLIGYLFEPDSRSNAALERSSRQRVFPVALGRERAVLPVHLCRAPEVSSLRKPNMEFLRRFPNADRLEVLSTDDVEVHALDDLRREERFDIDFLKLDTQGTELEILEGARDSLRERILGVEAEVEFQELYSGQSLFGDIARFMTASGFELLDFTRLVRWERHQISTFGQLQWGDAVFIRSPEAMPSFLSRLPDELVARKAARYIAILLLYHRPDLARSAMTTLSSHLSSAQRNAVGRTVDEILALQRTFTTALLWMNRALRRVGLQLTPMQP